MTKPDERWECDKCWSVAHLLTIGISDTTQTEEYERLRGLCTHGNVRRVEEGERCRADRDGDCTWDACPQLRDGEPKRSGRHCPLDDKHSTAARRVLREVNDEHGNEFVSEGYAAGDALIQKMADEFRRVEEGE